MKNKMNPGNKCLILALVAYMFIFMFFNTAYAEKEKTIIAFFKVQGCSRCLQVENILDKLDRDQVLIIIKDIGKKEDQELLMVFEDEFNVVENTRGVIPRIFVGNASFCGSDTNRDALEKAIENADNQKILNILQGKVKSTKVVNDTITKFSAFTYFTVGLAGLIDGINPCAITTLIFFISFLFLIKSNRRCIVLIGSSFISGTFIAYFLIGMGFLKTISTLTSLGLLLKILYPALALIAFVLCLISITDYIKMKKHKFHDVVLQLPEKIKLIIHRIIRSKYFLSILPVYGFFTGFAISFLEFLCTGQVYLPTIVYILSIPDLRLNAVFFLLLYVLCFILPMLFIFIIIYITSGVERIRSFISKNILYAKILTAAFFFIFTVYMILESIDIYGF